MSSLKPCSDLEDARPSLSLNERVVWISDNGPEYGNIRWLGKLPDLGREWMAGVEFDNPVGSGTGLYKDKQLFTTQLNHASLVPVIGLIKASDFGDTPQPPKRSSSVRLIDLAQESDFHHYRRSPLDFEQYKKTNQQHRIESNIKSQDPSPIKSKLFDMSMDIYNHSRVRNIPITIEKDQELHRLDEHMQRDPVSKPRVAPRSPQQDNPDIRSTDDISSLIKATSINGKQSQGGLPIVPRPITLQSGDDKHSSNATKQFYGKSRGIQGHNNSCYLDATLFAMFSTTTLFDSLLYRPSNVFDIASYADIQRILREDIVRPLRKDHFVAADQVMAFRTMLEQSSSVAGLTDEEKDPEEFLSLLLGQILKADPYLKLSSGLESFLYQLIVDKDESMVLPSVQDLFEQSFMNSTVRLREIPPCLLLQMPRFGRQYKMYPRIMPSPRLDITDVLEAVPRACGHRGKDCDNLARYECKGCFKERTGRARLLEITYCNNCFQSKHFSKSHSTGIEDHELTNKTTLQKLPDEITSRFVSKYGHSKDKDIPRVYMELFAVLCIETSHYVSFVKCGDQADSPWCFFDSMADRKGEQNGYNIPEVSPFEDFYYWTSEKGISYLLNHKDDKLLPEMARRLICDAYLCFYRYRGLMTYR